MEWSVNLYGIQNLNYWKCLFAKWCGEKNLQIWLLFPEYFLCIFWRRYSLARNTIHIKLIKNTYSICCPQENVHIKNRYMITIKYCIIYLNCTIPILACKNSTEIKVTWYIECHMVHDAESMLEMEISCILLLWLSILAESSSWLCEL